MNHVRRSSGSTLIVALIFVSVLIAAGTITFSTLQSRYRQVHQTATWQEALLAAEAGVELSVTEMRKELFDPDNAWSGWRVGDVDPAIPIVGTIPIIGALAPADSTKYYTSSVFLRVGEGGQGSQSKIAVDKLLVDGENWYRVRSTGVAFIPGGRVVAGEKADLQLRKFDLRYDHRVTDKVVAVAKPQASRLIEAIVKPVGTFRVALFAAKTIDLNNHNIVVDSYDSRNPNKSTNGKYDVAKRQERGSIATNGTLIEAGSAHIYGDASTNGGTVLNGSNVTGDIRNDFYQEIFAVKRPTVTADLGSPSSVQGSTVLTAKPGNPSQFILSSINLSGQSTLKIQGDPLGKPTYAQITVNGNISASGQGKIELGPGVHLRIFVSGDVDIGGNGVANPNSPLHLQVYGLDRPTNADGSPVSPGLMKIAGNGGFSGTLYAPHYSVKMVGGGSSDNIFGSFVGWDVAMTGIQSVHYDEALADGGLIADYKVVSWFEDTR